MAGKKDKKKEGDFYSFEDVLNELKLSEDELNKMISEGELRAYRISDENIVKFKKGDIEGMKSGKITEATVPLPSAEELLVPAEAVEEKPPAEEPPKVTKEAPLTDADITIPGLEEEKPPEVGPEDQATFIQEEAGAVTIPLGGEVVSEATIIEEALPEAAEVVTEEIGERPPGVKLPPPPGVKPRPSRVRPITLPPPEIKVHPIFVIMIGFTFLVLLFIGSLLSDTFRISTGKAKFPVGITRELGKLVVDIFGIKDEETEDPEDNINLDKYRP